MPPKSPKHQAGWGRRPQLLLHTCRTHARHSLLSHVSQQSEWKNQAAHQAWLTLGLGTGKEKYQILKALRPTLRLPTEANRKRQRDILPRKHTRQGCHGSGTVFLSFPRGSQDRGAGAWTLGESMRSGCVGGKKGTGCRTSGQIHLIFLYGVYLLFFFLRH